MLTFEDVTGYFLKAAASLDLVAHAEYWVNARSLEREFDCTCHIGSCEDAEAHSACTLSFTWSTLDTALSLEGPIGVCDFFHEPEVHCPQLHTRDIPPLVLDLAYTAPLTMNGASVYDSALLSLTQTLKLRASEQSSRAIETRPGVTFTLQESRLQETSQKARLFRAGMNGLNSCILCTICICYQHGLSTRTTYRTSSRVPHDLMSQA